MASAYVRWPGKLEVFLSLIGIVLLQIGIGQPVRGLVLQFRNGQGYICSRYIFFRITLSAAEIEGN